MITTNAPPCGGSVACSCGRGCNAENLRRADEVHARATALAGELLDLVGDEVNRFLIGGPREPYVNAVGHLTRVALDRGLSLEVARSAPTPQARRRKAADDSNVRQAREVWDRDGWRCVHCGDHRGLTVDHIVAVENGGSDDISNKQTLCGPCNSAKGTR